MRFVIEKMKPSDAKDVYELGRKTEELQVDRGVGQYYSEKSVKTMIKDDNHVLLVARVGKSVAGFVVFLCHKSPNEAYLSDIVVREEYRNLGIGKALFEKARLAIHDRKPNWAWAVVQEENSRMQKIMEKEGFKKGKKFYFYYIDKI